MGGAHERLTQRVLQLPGTEEDGVFTTEFAGPTKTTDRETGGVLVDGLQVRYVSVGPGQRVPEGVYVETNVSRADFNRSPHVRATVRAKTMFDLFPESEAGAIPALSLTPGITNSAGHMVLKIEAE